MKPTLITENIDGHEIVRGLGRAVIDPVQAKALIVQELPNTTEYQDWLQVRETGDAAAINAAYDALLLKRRAIVEAAEIFCTPKAGETIITDEEAALNKSDIEALPEKSCLTTAGDVIEDRRGDKFWYQDEYTDEWTQSAIVTLGEELPATGVFHIDMTTAQQIEIAEQKEAIRLDGLSQEEKQAEFDQMLLAARREAVFIRSEKELAGMDSAQALKEAQAWLAERKAELIEKYGIIEEA